MSRNTPRETHGWKSTVMYSSGVASCAGMPRFMKKLPKTLLSTTTVAQIQVFTRSRAVSVSMRAGLSLVAGPGGRGRRLRGRLVFGHKPFAFGAQRHILACFFRQPLAL